MYTCSDLVMSMIILSIQVFYLLGFVITSQQGNAYSLEPCVCGKNPTSTEYLGISSLLGTLLKTLGSLFNSMGSLSRPKVELGLVLLSVKRILFSFLFLKTELPRNSMIKGPISVCKLGLPTRKYILQNVYRKKLNKIRGHIKHSMSSCLFLSVLSGMKWSRNLICYQCSENV